MIVQGYVLCVLNAVISKVGQCTVTSQNYCQSFLRGLRSVVLENPVAVLRLQRGRGHQMDHSVIVGLELLYVCSDFIGLFDHMYNYEHVCIHGQVSIDTLD